MKRSLAALGVALVAGCASPAQRLDEARQSWQGATHEEVVARWGPPATANGTDSQTWISEGQPWQPSPSVGVGVFGGSGGGGVGVGIGVPIGQPEPVSRCERTMVFKDGRVVDQVWVGPEKYCAAFRRGA